MIDQIRVLMVDDDEDDVLLVRDMLRESRRVRYDLDWTAGYAEGLRRLASGEFHACLLDYRLGDRSGIEFIREVIANGGATRTPPIILLTGQGDYDVDLAAMAAGAADYLNKNALSADLLERTIRYAVRTRRAEEERLRLVGERARAEVAAAAAREDAERLEELVRERTAELEASHRRLRLSERMAALGTFSAGLGHDMGNLLLPIRARLDVLKTRDLPPDVQDDLDAIGACASYLQALARGLRLFALDPDDEGASAPATELGPWSREAVPFLRTALGRRIALEAELPDDLPPVAVAPHRLTQAVLNLVNNARDAIGKDRPGRVAIRARRQGTAEHARFVELSIQDDGPGMPPDVVARAMEPFFTTKRRGISTGLGLALVHGIVQAAGGEVQIDSTPGAGTTITLVLPIARPPEPSAAETPGVAAVSIRDPRIRSMVSGVLGVVGFDIRQTDHGAPDEADLWVTDAASATPRSACQFVRARPSRRVVAVGVEDDAAAEWMAAGAITLPAGAGPGAIRSAALGGPPEAHETPVAAGRSAGIR